MTTETTRHTPGPWAVETINLGFLPVEVEDGPDFWPIVDPRTTFKIGDVYTTADDARLIAAAPEMAAFIKKLSGDGEGNGWYLLEDTFGATRADEARALLRRLEG